LPSRSKRTAERPASPATGSPTAPGAGAPEARRQCRNGERRVTDGSPEAADRVLLGGGRPRDGRAGSHRPAATGPAGARPEPAPGAGAAGGVVPISPAVGAAGGPSGPAQELGSALRQSANAAGVEVQQRNAVSIDPRIRGYRTGQYLATGDGAAFFPARLDLDT